MPYLKYGAGGMQAEQEAQMNDQVMKMRNLSMDAMQLNLQDAQREDAIKQSASQMMQTLMKGGSVGSTDTDQTTSYSQALDKVGQKLASVGAMDMATKYFNASGKLQKQEQDAMTESLNKKKAIATLRSKESAYLGSLAKAAITQEEWDQGIKTGYQNGTLDVQTAQHMLTVPWAPESMRFIARKAMTVAEQAKQDLSSQQEQRIASHESIMEGIANRNSNIAKARLHEMKRYHTQVAKNGKPATAPNNNEFAAAQTAVNNLIFPDGLPKDINSALNDKDNVDARGSATYIAYVTGIQNVASEAKRMTKDDPGSSFQENVNKAILLQQQRGEWLGQGNDIRFDGMGKTVDDAIPLPQTVYSKNGAIDQSKLKAKTYYLGNGGNTYYWDGKQLFEVK